MESFRHLIDLSVAAATNICCIYLVVTTLVWVRDTRRTPRRDLLVSILVIKTAMFLWSGSIMYQVLEWQSYPMLATLPARCLVLAGVIYQLRVLSRVRADGFTCDGG